MKKCLIIEDFYKERPPRVYEICPTLRSDRIGLLVLILEDNEELTGENNVR